MDPQDKVKCRLCGQLFNCKTGIKEFYIDMRQRLYKKGDLTLCTKCDPDVLNPKEHRLILRESQLKKNETYFKESIKFHTKYLLLIKWSFIPTKNDSKILNKILEKFQINVYCLGGYSSDYHDISQGIITTYCVILPDYFNDLIYKVSLIPNKRTISLITVQYERNYAKHLKREEICHVFPYKDGWVLLDEILEPSSKSKEQYYSVVGYKEKVFS